MAHSVMVAAWASRSARWCASCPIISQYALSAAGSCASCRSTSASGSAATPQSPLPKSAQGSWPAAETAPVAAQTTSAAARPPAPQAAATLSTRQAWHV